MQKAFAERRVIVAEFILSIVREDNVTNWRAIKEFRKAVYSQYKEETNNFKIIDNYLLAAYLLNGGDRPELGETLLGNYIKTEAAEALNKAVKSKKRKGKDTEAIEFNDSFVISEPLVSGSRKLILRRKDGLPFELIVNDRLYNKIVFDWKNLDNMYQKVKGLILIQKIFESLKKKPVGKVERRVAKVLTCKETHGCRNILEAMPYTVVKGVFDEYERLTAARKERKKAAILEETAKLMDALKEKMKEDSNMDLVRVISSFLIQGCYVASIIMEREKRKDFYELTEGLRTAIHESGMRRHCMGMRFFADSMNHGLVNL